MTFCKLNNNGNNEEIDNLNDKHLNNVAFSQRFNFGGGLGDGYGSIQNAGLLIAVMVYLLEGQRMRSMYEMVEMLLRMI